MVTTDAHELFLDPQGLLGEEVHRGDVILELPEKGVSTFQDAQRQQFAVRFVGVVLPNVHRNLLHAIRDHSGGDENFGEVSGVLARDGEQVDVETEIIRDLRNRTKYDSF